jgi:hypothetical protein
MLSLSSELDLYRVRITCRFLDGSRSRVHLCEWNRLSADSRRVTQDQIYWYAKRAEGT